MEPKTNSDGSVNDSPQDAVKIGTVQLGESALEQIRAWVQKGDVEITQIIAPPRSLSTCLLISLSEGAQGNHINEPFWQSTTEEAMQQILKRLKDCGADDPQTPKPIRLVIKDISTHVKGLEEYKDIIKNFVLLARNPRAQVPAYMKMSAPRFVKGISPTMESALQYGDVIDAELAKQNYAKTGWLGLQNVHTQLTRHSFLSSNQTLCVMDADMLCQAPEATMRQCCEQIGFDYSSPMILGEKLAGGENFYHPNSQYVADGDGKRFVPGNVIDPWTRDACNSKEYRKSMSKDTPALDKLPKGIQAHIKFAEEIYHTIQSTFLTQRGDGKFWSKSLKNDRTDRKMRG